MSRRPSAARLRPVAERLRADSIRRMRHSTVGERLVERRRARLIAASPWFDPEWYLAAHDDLIDVDPLTHFLLHGESEGRDPSPEFDTPAYVWCNPGAVGAALTHFLTAAAPGQRPEHVVDLSRPVLADRWFDPDWYASQHPDLDLEGLDLGSRTAIAWRYYRRVGGPPSPWFDREDFEIRNGVDATPEPLTAWDARRDGPVLPGRVLAPNDTGRRGPLARPAILPRAELAEVRVAVAIHAFHLDLLADLLERVRWIPGRVTVLVTTTELGEVDAIDARITAVLGGIDRAVRFTPNAGRNFGPLLAGLEHDLRAHDVLLHLHTKKSLASGSEQVEWRQHLVDGLLPSPAAVQAIVSALASSDVPRVEYTDEIAGVEARPIGVVHAPTWPGLPTYANHWLGNRGLGAQLFDALGLDLSDASGWLDYPVGGMFWMRVDAIRPLLDLTIQFAEFGEELGQTDRTLAHAIERVLPAVADAAGFDVVELDVDAAEWRHRWSDRNLDGVGGFATSMGHLDALLDRADVVSADLFDTLLLRPTTDPDGLFDLLGGLIDTDADPLDVVTARRRAEHELRIAPGAPGDVTLAEIIARMISDHGVSEADARALRTAELELEHRLAIPRRWLIDRLRRLRRDRPDTALALMTDTTQPPDAIEALLERLGAGDLFTDLFVSNERRARKDSGSLWRQLEDAHDPQLLVHLGDNPSSDLQQASDRGHHWFQTPAPGELPAMGGVELRHIGPTGIGSRRRATEFLVGHGLAIVAAGTDDRGLIDDEVFGAGVVGPVATAFARWCLETAIDRGLDVVCFGGRDGHLVHAIAERLAPHVAGAPRLAYLPISRRVALGARLAHDDGLDALIAAGPWEGTIGDLLAVRAGVDVQPASLADRIVSLPDDHDVVRAALAEFDLHAHGRAEAGGLRAAVTTLAGTADRLGLVDLGYSGTILRAIRPVLDQDVVGLFGVTTASVADLDDIDVCFTTHAKVGHGDLIYDRAKVWEVLFSRPDDQAEAYDLVDGAARLRTVPDTAPPPDVAEVVERVQRAALGFVDDHLERFGSSWLGAPVAAPMVRRAMQASIGRGVPEPNELFRRLTVDDGFRGLGRIPVVDG